MIKQAKFMEEYLESTINSSNMFQPDKTQQTKFYIGITKYNIPIFVGYTVAHIKNKGIKANVVYDKESKSVRLYDAYGDTPSIISENLYKDYVFIFDSHHGVYNSEYADTDLLKLSSQLKRIYNKIVEQYNDISKLLNIDYHNFIDNIFISCINGFAKYSMQLCCVYVASFIYDLECTYNAQVSKDKLLRDCVNWTVKQINKLIICPLYDKIAYKFIEMIIKHDIFGKSYNNKCEEELIFLKYPSRIVENIGLEDYQTRSMIEKIVADKDYMRICKVNEPYLHLPDFLINNAKDIGFTIDDIIYDIPDNNDVLFDGIMSYNYSCDRIDIIIIYGKEPINKYLYMWAGAVSIDFILTGKLDYDVLFKDILDKLQYEKRNMYKFKDYCYADNEYYFNKYIDTVCDLSKDLLDNTYEFDKRDLFEFAQITNDDMTNRTIYEEIIRRLGD